MFGGEAVQVDPLLLFQRLTMSAKAFRDLAPVFKYELCLHLCQIWCFFHFIDNMSKSILIRIRNPAPDFRSRSGSCSRQTLWWRNIHTSFIQYLSTLVSYLCVNIYVTRILGFCCENSAAPFGDSHSAGYLSTYIYDLYLSTAVPNLVILSQSAQFITYPAPLL